jgi:ACS family tartrate transporter-like MFS transporter
MSAPDVPAPSNPALDSARRKAFWRLLPLCFISYIVAYVDRSNVALAKINMAKDMPWLTNVVYGTAYGIFFLGYVPLEIPGTLLVERWSARKWISRIMITWGIIAALTAAVKSPGQFYAIRFLLGLGEAGFFPGVIVYLTHWFPSRDRARALATFLIATPTAQIISPKITAAFLQIGTDKNHPEVWGLEGWQWVYIAWGIPAVIMGVVVFFLLTDRPRQAKWLTAAERDALEAELERERAMGLGGRRHVKVLEALRSPRVLILALAYFLTTSANYGFESFVPSILERWYSLKMSSISSLVILPPVLALCGQLFVGWNSDRTKERRWHAIVPLLVGATGLVLATQSRGHLPLTIMFLMLAFAGIKSYQPAFWSLPSQFLTGAAAAGSIGFINSIGNLGGAFGPQVIGRLESWTGSFVGGVLCLAASMTGTATIVFLLRLKPPEPTPRVEPKPASATR